MFWLNFDAVIFRLQIVSQKPVMIVVNVMSPVYSISENIYELSSPRVICTLCQTSLNFSPMNVRLVLCL